MGDVPGSSVDLIGRGVEQASRCQEVSPISGKLEALFRFPFKSMAGESLSGVQVTLRGLLGDRLYAFLDDETGNVASAKHPAKWGVLLDCQSSFIAEPGPSGDIPPLRIHIPGSDPVRSDDPSIHSALSTYLNRRGKVSVHPPAGQPLLEMDWPDVDGLFRTKNTVTVEGIPPGSFFDVTPVHVLTSASLRALALAYPEANLDLARFRPNFFIDWPGTGFAEKQWVGKEIGVGEEVILGIEMESPRCAMVTTPQQELTQDVGILRALARENGSHLGVYARVIRPGTVRLDDPVRVL